MLKSLPRTPHQVNPAKTPHSVRTTTRDTTQVYWSGPTRALKSSTCQEGDQSPSGLGPLDSTCNTRPLPPTAQAPKVALCQYWRCLAEISKDMAHKEFQDLLHCLGPPPQLPACLQHPQDPPPFTATNPQHLGQFLCIPLTNKSS